jgi:FMN phosphatase YigB (HAD superfamily)
MFDLDGTLLPMDQKEFVEAYMKMLVMRFAPLGFDKEAIIKGLWAGVKAMMENDGTVLNEQRFWDTFLTFVPDEDHIFRDQIDDFYRTEFKQVQKVVHKTEDSRRIIDMLQQKGYRLILATNPLFPPCAVEERLSWVNLRMEDFSYVTTYDNCRGCKPKLSYYRDIIRECHLDADHCMMVGNNVNEDMGVRKLNTRMKMYLITDFIENPLEECITIYPHGSLADFAKVVEDMPEVPKRVNPFKEEA